MRFGFTVSFADYLLATVLVTFLLLSILLEWRWFKRWFLLIAQFPLRWPYVRFALMLLVLIGFGVAACGSPTTVSTLEVALTAADQAALAYVTLPLCPQPNGVLCSVATTSANIKLAAALAYKAVKAAEASGAAADLTAAQTSVTSLTAITPATPSP